MVQDVKDLGAELHVEVLRDTPDVVILEDGKVQVGDARTRQDISARIAAEVKALQIGEISALTIVRGKKSSVRRSGHGKALGLNVVVGISGIRQGLASRPAEPIRKSPVVVVLGNSWIIPCPPGCREWDAVADGEDGAKFPSIGKPSGWSRK